MQKLKLLALSSLILVVGIAAGAVYAMRTIPVIDDSSNAVIPPAETVAAEVRPIASVLVLEASVVANPVFQVTAPIDGTAVIKNGRLGIKAAKTNTVKLIELPSSSKVEEYLVAPGQQVKAGLPVLRARYTGFALQATVSPEKIYRLYDGIISTRGEIMNGPGPFTSLLLGTPFVPDGSEMDASRQGLVVVVATPEALNLLEGSRGLLALTTAEVEKAVVLPVRAVAGINQKGQIYVDDNGETVLQDVSLGITDGAYVQITEGLSAGEKVVLPSPSIKNLQ